MPVPTCATRPRRLLFRVTVRNVRTNGGCGSRAAGAAGSGTTPFDAEMARGSPALPKKRPVAATEFRHGNAHIEIAAASLRCVPQWRAWRAQRSKPR